MINVPIITKDSLSNIILYSCIVLNYYQCDFSGFETKKV